MSQSAFERPCVAVIAALGAELRQLRSMRLPRGVRIFQSGPGRAASRQAANRAVASGAQALLSWGLAGGLKPGVETGSVILASQVTDAAGLELRGDARWGERLQSRLPAELTVHVGSLLSTDRVLSRVEDKAAAARASGALGVDMETHALASVAAAHELPWIALRVVADSAFDELPASVAGCVDGSGNTRLAGVVQLMLRPAQWPALIKIGRSYRRAARTLAVLAGALGPTGFGLAGPQQPST